MSKQYKQQLIKIMAVGALASAYGPVSAAGFALLDVSTADMSTAFSGTAARAEGAETGYYNSAGLTRLGDEQISVSGIGVIPNTRVTAISATPSIVIPPALGGVPNIGPGKARSRAFSIIPALHYVKRLSDCWAFGFNATIPFGLKTKYRQDSVARYLTTRAEIRTYDLSPSLAYSFGNGFSLGAGIDFLHTLVKFDTSIGTGVAVRDGSFENTLSRWSLAGHVGALWEITDCTRIGIQYRSGSKVKGKGESIQVAGPALTPLRVTNVNQGIRSNINLPASVVLSGYTDITEQWAIMADIQYTNWKKFNNVVARFDDGSVLTQNYNFRNSTRYAIGTSYAFSDCWLGRFGVGFDRSAVRKNIRTVTIPDANRTMVAFGLRYQINPCLAVDAGYAHVFFRNSYINQVSPTWTGHRVQQTLKGRYRNRADLVGLQLTWDIA